MTGLDNYHAAKKADDRRVANNRIQVLSLQAQKKKNEDQSYKDERTKFSAAWDYAVPTENQQYLSGVDAQNRL